MSCSSSSYSNESCVGWPTGKRTSENADLFIQDLRGRVIGVPEISTDGLHYYRPAIRDAFAGRAAHGVIKKTYSVVQPIAPIDALSGAGITFDVIELRQ